MNAKPEPRSSNLKDRRSRHPAIPVEHRDDAESTEQDTTPAKKIGRPVGTGRNIDTKTRSVTITLSILEESLNAVAFLKDNPNAPRTFTQLLDQALYEKNAQLRDEYNDGEPFPQREGKLRPGPR